MIQQIASGPVVNINPHKTTIMVLIICISVLRNRLFCLFSSSSLLWERTWNTNWYKFRQVKQSNLKLFNLGNFYHLLGLERIFCSIICTLKPFLVQYTPTKLFCVFLFAVTNCQNFCFYESHLLWNVYKFLLTTNYWQSLQFHHELTHHQKYVNSRF